MKNNLLKNLIAASMIIMMVGCVTYTRENNPANFPMLLSGKIPQNKIPLFNDCLIDGFQGSQSVFKNLSVSQQQRSNGFRIDAVAGGTMTIVSVDILNDGNVLLYESKTASLINTTGEHKSFKNCLEKFQ